MNRFEKPISWSFPAEKESSDWAHSKNEAASGENQDDAPLMPSQTGPWSQVHSQRSFFLPIHYSAGYQYPLVVWLHSDGFNENQIDQVMPHISLRNYVGVGIRGNRAADSSGHRFDWHDSPAAIGMAHDNVIDAVDEASDRFSVHSKRIVLAGYGAGGTMALRIAMRDPRRIAAAVSIGGRMPQGAIRNLDQLRDRRLPMLWQWASENPCYTTAGLKSDCQTAMAIGAQVEVRQYPGSDEMDTVILSDFDRWVMQQVVSVKSEGSDRWATTPTAYSVN